MSLNTHLPLFYMVTDSRVGWTIWGIESRSRGHILLRLCLEKQDTACVLTEALSKKRIKKCFCL